MARAGIPVVMATMLIGCGQALETQQVAMPEGGYVPDPAVIAALKSDPMRNDFRNTAIIECRERFPATVAKSGLVYPKDVVMNVCGCATDHVLRGRSNLELIAGRVNETDAPQCSRWLKGGTPAETSGAGGPPDARS